MGWAPGVGLGSDLQGEKDNVKYSLKDDLLGVGAKKEYGGGVWRGMGEVDDLYKRLDVGNGAKTPNGVEENAEVMEVKEEVRLKGGWKMRFQAGDTYTSSFSREESEVDVTSGESTPPVKDVQAGDNREKKTKKRKREDEGEKKSEKEKSVDKEKVKPRKSKNENSKDKEAEKPVKEKKKRKAKEAKSKSSAPIAMEPEKKKRRKSEKDNVQTANKESADTKPTTNGTPTASKSEKDKKSRKDKKEQKAKSSSKPEKVSKKSSSSKKDKKKDKSSKSTDSDITVPIPVTTSVTAITETIVAPRETDRTSPVPRHMHRSRYLAMKRAATMDKNALREILGVKG